jgi:AraC family transcriptional regulator of arabinose operon
MTCDPIRICSAGVLRQDPTWRWSMSGLTNRQYVFWIVVDGRGTLRAATDTIALRRGVCVVSPLRDAHDGVQAADHLLHIPWTVYEYLDQSTGQAVVPTRPPKRVRPAEDVDVLRALTERAVDAHFGGPGRAHEASLWMQAALLEVERLDQAPTLYGTQRELFSRIDELSQKVRRAPGAPYTLDSMAAAVHYTPDHLVRLFRKYKGVTPVEYVIRCRMELAQQLLLFSGLPVRRIAETAGYRDVAHFSRQFSRRIGMPPSAFRRQSEVR